MNSKDLKKNREGYKKTIIGLLPEDWEQEKLEDLVKFLDSDREPVKQSERAKVDDVYPYYGASGIIDYVEDYLFDDDLILLAEDGANIINRSSPIAFKVSGKCWVNNHAHVLKPKEEAELRYVLEYLESIRYEKYNTSTAQPKLSQTTCRKIPIPKPPLAEQKAIAEIFSTLYEAISNLKKLIKAKKRYKKGLMQQLLSGEKRFPEFQDEPWIEVKIGDLLKEVEREVDWDDSAKYDLISVKRRSEGIVHRESLYGHEIKTKNLKTVKAGDYIISRMQVLHGASALATKEFEGTKVSGSYHTLVVRDEDKLDIGFFNYLSQTPYLYHLAYISSHGVHIEKMTFKIDDYLKKKIRIPSSVEEQAKIVSVLDNIEKQISLYQNELEAVKKQKKGLMQQLLTGKTRVKTEGAQHAV